MSTRQSQNKDLWTRVGEVFDETLPRRRAIFLKPSDDALIFAYPARWGTPGYYFDQRAKTTYEEDPAFKLELCPYVFGGLRNGQYSTLMSHYYERQVYYPSLVEKRLIFSSLGLEATETFSRTVQGGFSWQFDFTSACVHHSIDKILYFVASPAAKCDRLIIKPRKGLFTLAFENQTMIVSAGDVDWGAYNTVDAYLGDIHKGRLSRSKSGRKYLVLGYRVKLEAGRSVRFQLGLSFDRESVARQCRLAGDLKRPVRRHWNAWFNSLPALPFDSEQEQKAYYKSWWVTKNNYYRDPKIGPSVLEAFPVYRGYWLWGLTAYEWNSAQNTEFCANFLRKVLDLFLDNQRADGYLTHAIYLDEKVPGERWMKKGITQTPHIPWIALRYFFITRDRQSLARWFPGLRRFYEYLNQSRDPERRHLWSITTSYDTGLDTTSVFDKVTLLKNGKKQEEYCYPAIFGAERARYEQAMEKIAAILDHPDASGWTAQAELTRQALNRDLWDARKKWYGVRHQNHELDTRVGIDGLFPFCYGLATPDRARQARANFKKLIGPYGVYSVAPGEPGFYEETYWRGPTWPKTCSCAIVAASRYYPDLMAGTRDALVAMLLAHPSVWECMSARTGKIARGDIGCMATAVVSSNVGSGEAVGALFTAHGIDAFSIEEALPLVPVRNFHWAGFRLDVVRAGRGFRVAVRKAERKAGEIVFRQKTRLIRLTVTAGRSYSIAGCDAQR